MSDSDWLSTRTPAPPDDLAAAIRQALKARNIDSASPSPTELLAAAQSLLEKVLATECAERASALDLLTADALVTYALEVANEAAPSDFSERAMARLASAGKRVADSPTQGGGDASRES